MNIDVPKLPQNPKVVIERGFSSVAENDHALDDHAKQSPPVAGDWGGYFVTTSGTAASGTSLSTVQMQSIPYFIPSEGINPVHEQELNQTARNLEQKVNPTPKNKT